MRAGPNKQPTRMNNRRRTLIGLAVAAMLLVPVAMAWACNPQAYLRLDQSGYAAGDQMGVSGAFFKANRELTLSFEPGGDVAKVTTSGNGFFATQLTAPSKPGSYTLSAVGYEADGSVTPGLPARISFEVTAPSQAPSDSQPGANQPEANQPGANQPGAQPQPGAEQPDPGRFAEPETPEARAFSSPGGGSRGGREPAARGGGGAGDRGGAVANGDGVIDTAGGEVFAGSVARDERGALASSGASAPTTSSGESDAAAGQPGGGAEAPSERSAGGDVWSGFGSADAPSLMTGANDPALGRDTGSQLGWGLGLLGLGLLALVAGLAVPAVRRRRAERETD